MIRARFHTVAADYRPAKWPLRLPYWVSGQDSQGWWLVAYADSLVELMALWPEAEQVEAVLVTEVVYTSRFPMPSWLRHAPEVEAHARIELELDAEEKSMGQARRYAIAMRLLALNPAIELGLTIGILLGLNNMALQFRDVYNLPAQHVDFMATIEQALDLAEVPAPGATEPEG